jgi:hypothetical protein
LLKQPDKFGTHSVEILPDPNLSLPSPKRSPFSRPTVRDEPRDWFTGLASRPKKSNPQIPRITRMRSLTKTESHHSYPADEKGPRRKHRTEATVGTEDVLFWAFWVFPAARHASRLAYTLARPLRFSWLRDSRTRQCHCQFLRGHRDLRASLSPSGTRRKGDRSNIDRRREALHE